MATGAAEEESLKRLGGGRWQTRDERFTIEPQSGTWAVVDATETDDLGLPLVRGPFRSLTDAKAAIATARSSAAPTSPLAGRVDQRTRSGGTSAAAQSEPADRAAPGAGEGGRGSPADSRTNGKGRRARPATSTGPPAADARSGAAEATPAAAAPASARKERAEPEEPGWFRDLEPADRGRARQLIERLTAGGSRDAVSIVRRDLVGDVPAVAAASIERRLAALPSDASVTEVADLLAEGRDADLGVRWRLVDGDDRPITLDLRSLRRRR